jgi:hypothetical protein
MRRVACSISYAGVSSDETFLKTIPIETGGLIILSPLPEVLEFFDFPPSQGKSNKNFLSVSSVPQAQRVVNNIVPVPLHKKDFIKWSLIT